MFDGVLAQVCLIVGPVGTWTHPVVISHFSEYGIGIDILRNWQNSHTGSPTINGYNGKGYAEAIRTIST